MKRILQSYREALGAGLETALDRCAQEYIAQLEATAPRQAPGDAEGKPYHQSFAVKDGYRGVRYVGNKKTVKGAESDSIPLINILEAGRGPNREGARPHMNEALLATADAMQQIIAEEIERVK
jgi:hypothetical protein